MYDSPKAIHFVALHNGDELHHSDPVGIRQRWAAAGYAASLGIWNMMRITAFDWDRLEEALGLAASDYEVRIAVRRPE